MILPDKTIKELSLNKTPPLISTFEETNLRGSSYDLTIGSEYYIDQGSGSTSLETQSLRERQSFTVPPHAVCFILTTESITLPLDITAKVSMRMPHIYAGMVLTSQPPFDPGYNGKAIVMLHNLSSVPVFLKRGERIATIEFSRLEEPRESLPSQSSVTSIEQSLSRPLVSSLSEMSKKSQSAVDKVNSLSGQMLAFAALVVAILAIPGLFSYTGLADRISKIEALQEALREQKSELAEARAEAAGLKERLVLLESHSSLAAEDVPSQNTQTERVEK